MQSFKLLKIFKIITFKYLKNFLFLTKLIKKRINFNLIISLIDSTLSKMNPRTIKNFKISVLAAIVVSLASFFLKLTPCFTNAKISLCQIPNPFLDITLPLSKFYNISNNPILAILVQFLIPFILVFIILFFFKIRKKKVIDFTRKSI